MKQLFYSKVLCFFEPFLLPYFPGMRTSFENGANKDEPPMTEDSRVSIAWGRTRDTSPPSPSPPQSPPSQSCSVRFFERSTPSVY